MIETLIGWLTISQPLPAGRVRSATPLEVRSTRRDPELKAEFSARIKELLVKVSAADIAVALKVKRQMVYNYRDGRNAPSPEVIRRAMESWSGFALTYRGKSLTLQDFQRRPVLTARKALQYELWDAIKELDSESLEIEILRKEASSVQLGVRIHFRRR